MTQDISAACMFLIFVGLLAVYMWLSHAYVRERPTMQLYKTTGIDKEDTSPDLVSWEASQTDASKRRTALKAMGYRATSQTVQVPTAKGPLLEWLNENVKS